MSFAFSRFSGTAAQAVLLLSSSPQQPFCAQVVSASAQLLLEEACVAVALWFAMARRGWTSGGVGVDVSDSTMDVTHSGTAEVAAEVLVKEVDVNVATEPVQAAAEASIDPLVSPANGGGRWAAAVHDLTPKAGDVRART